MKLWSFSILLFLNALGLILCGVDKFKAIHHSSRIAEKTFYLLGFCGSSIGILMGMVLFHHKTNKPSFQRVLFFTLLCNAIMLAVWIKFGIS